MDSIQLETYFAEPADVWTNPTAAFAPGNFGRRFVEICVDERRDVASIAAALEQLSVHVNDVSCTCLLVKVVHVLGADK
jgi:hypothetical protein